VRATEAVKLNQNITKESLFRDEEEPFKPVEQPKPATQTAIKAAMGNMGAARAQANSKKKKRSKFDSSDDEESSDSDQSEDYAPPKTTKPAQT
jgi:hypothetical protein